MIQIPYNAADRAVERDVLKWILSDPRVHFVIPATSHAARAGRS